jgi:hypothetical protein
MIWLLFFANFHEINSQPEECGNNFFECDERFKAIFNLTSAANKIASVVRIILNLY